MNYKVTVVLADGSHVPGYARTEYSIGNYGTVLVTISGKPFRASEIVAKGMRIICIEGEVREVLKDAGFPVA